MSRRSSRIAALETKKSEPLPTTKPNPSKKTRKPTALGSGNIATTSKQPIPSQDTPQSILDELLEDVEQDKEYIKPLPLKRIMYILSKSGFLEKSFMNEDKEKFLQDCWTFYSGSPLSYMINKYMYLRPNNKLELTNPNYTTNDFIMLYQNLPNFRYYINPYIEKLSKEPLNGQEVPLDMNVLMELLIIGLQQIMQLQDKYPQFFSTTDEHPTLYRGFRLVGEDTDLLIRSNKSFISTTSSIDIALQHAKPVTNEKSILIIYEFESTVPLVKVNKIYTDILISAFTKQSEEEYLLMPGYKFKLIDTGIFTKESKESIHTFRSRKDTESETVTEQAISVPYYKIRVGVTTPK
jgi:hypothetical protein